MICTALSTAPSRIGDLTRFHLIRRAFEGLTEVPAFNDAFLGGTVGGPIARDKLFFFAGVNSEILNQTEVFAAGQLTPTPAGLETTQRLLS